MPTSPHRERYHLLFERRRALIELERLHERICSHHRWAAACEARAGLGKALAAHVNGVRCGLCSRACQADSGALLCDLRKIYLGLVVMARAWVALEDGSDVARTLGTSQGA